MSELGRLMQVSLREIWTHEATGFSNWLSQEENLKLLSDTVGLDLALEGVEQNVGPFRADVLCKATGNSDHWVLIENQIERTDHTHLGQLITYAAGLHTATIIWIAQTFREEHRAALDWLNEITKEEISFFGLEIELWRIANSPAAPKFNIVSKPNAFVKQSQTERAQTITSSLYSEYWEAFNEFVRANSKVIRPMKAGNDSWMNFSIGKSNCCIGVALTSRNKKGWVYFHIYNDPAKNVYRSLETHRAQLDAQIPGLEWDEKPGRQASQVRVTRSFDPAVREDWSKQHGWILDELEQFQSAFGPLVGLLP